MADREDYESDPEEAHSSLAMRRRRASDDEEEEGGDTDGENPPLTRSDSRAGVGSDGESDGQGGVGKYDDDETEDDEIEEEEDEEEEYGEDYGEGFVERVDADDGGAVGAEGKERVEELEGERSGMVVESMAQVIGVEEEVVEGEKKENEPFAVPTAGAFYMHDDRFRDSSGGRHRRTLGGRRLWESKDDRKWGHDKFEEMTVLERRYEEGRRIPKGQFRGRGRNRGPDRGFARGSRARIRTNNQIMGHAPKDFRGRGPRKYEPLSKDTSEPPQMQNRLPGKSFDKSSQISSQRLSVATSHGDFEPVRAQNQVFASSLNSASPPFYPSGSSNKEVAMPQEKDVQAGVANRNSRIQLKDERFPTLQSNALLRGKNVVNTIGMDKLYLDDFASPTARKPLTNMQLATGSSLNNTGQPPQPRPQGRGFAHPGQMTFQLNSSHNQVSRAMPAQLSAAQRTPMQAGVQPSLQDPGQALGRHLGVGSQSSSPPKTALSVNSFEPEETESSPESSKTKNALAGKESSGVQGSGRGLFLYTGAQPIGASGNMGVGRGDQNFPSAPAFLPVMQFGGRHPGRIGVPAVGMAFPGYVAQPQRGVGNSEMTWLPLLAGAGAGAGALGATYCSPYMTVDGAFQGRPSGQTSSTSISSKDNNTSKSNSEWTPPQGPELVTDEFGQRQNKPRRYSEMSFGQ